MAHITQTFSDMWYRVAEFRPRLSAHLAVRRQTYRHETWFLLGDPASSKFYRFNASAYRFLGLLDGKRTVQEAWDVCNAQLGDDAPTQTDCLNLLAQLQLFGLLRNDLPIDPDRLRERIEKIREQKHAERVGGYVFYTIPLVNPERFLAKYANVARAVFSMKGYLLLGLLFIVALSQVVPRWDELSLAANNIIAPDNLFWFSISLLVLKVFHEYAHGFCCKAYGGRVTEIGVFMMMILPLPYCDATSSWAFTSKWHRILVGAAGMMIEVAIACVAAIIWAHTAPGLVHTLAYNVMFIASVMTVVFNLNPLLRYDGYYILADLLEIPNLAPRSLELLKYLARRYLFGLKGETPPAIESKREAGWMIAHAICAFPYRLLVVTGIVLFVAQQYLILGFLVGIFGAIMWLIVPVLKGLSYVISDPSIQMVRPRAVGVTFGLIAIVILFLGVVPMPNHVWASGVIEPSLMKSYRAANNGYVERLAVRNGDYVESGQVMLQLFNPILEGDYRKSKARLEMESIRLSAATASSAVDRRLAEPMFADAVAQYDTVKHIYGEMQVRAEFPGWVIAPDIAAREGAFVTQGAELVTVASLDDMIIRAYISDTSFALLVGEEEYCSIAGDDAEERTKWEHTFAGHHIQAEQIEGKVRGMAGRTFGLEVDEGVTVGVRGLRYPSLGHVVKGGEITLDPSDPNHQSTIVPQWEITLRFKDPSAVGADSGHRWLEDRRNVSAAPAVGGEPAVRVGNLMALPGERVRVRFTLKSEPLAFQWGRSLRRAFNARFGM